MFIFKGTNTKIASSPTYMIVNIIFFVVVVILFFGFIIRLIRIFIKTESIKRYNKSDIIVLGLVAIFSIFLVFILLKGSIWGRFPILNNIMGNIFIKEVFEGVGPRTYSMVVYSILQTVFQVKVTPITVLMVNKVFSVLILIVVFLISKIIFKKNWISLIVFFSFISSIFVRTVFVSIEHGTGSLLFTYASILFLFIFMKNKDLNFFIISNICLLLAVFYRYELTILFGIPYIAYYCIFLYDDKRTRKYMVMTTIILIISAMVLISVLSIHGTTVEEGIGDEGLLGLIKNSENMLKNSILIEKDLNLKSGRVSLFTYSGFSISILFTIMLVYNLIKRKKILSKYVPIFLLAFYNAVYFIFQLSFQGEGFREGWKTSVNYFLCEIILTYFVIFLLVDKIAINKPKYIRNIAKLISISLFFILALVSTTALSYNLNEFYAPNPPETIEMYALIENVKLDESCKIIKVSFSQPLIDYFFGLQRNALYFGNLPEFYESLRAYEKQDKCFYYYDAKHFTEYDYENKIAVDINLQKVNKIFGDCKKELVFEFDNQKQDDFHRTFSLFKYTC